MTHWETIQDRSAYLSQVKLVPPKNYSVEKGNVIFDAVSKTSIPLKKPHLSHQNQKQNKYNKRMFKSVYFNWILLLLINIMAVSLYWTCSTSKLDCVNTTLDRPYVWINDTRNLIQQRVTQPLILKWNEENPYHWINTKETVHGLGNKLKETSDQAVQNHIKPLYHSAQEKMNSCYHSTQEKMISYYQSAQEKTITYYHLAQEKMIVYYHSLKNVMFRWIDYIKQQIDDYVKYGGHEEIKETDTIVEEKIKKTAKRILDYINQLNQENVQTGMKSDQAKKKAQDIIKSITKESNLIITEAVNTEEEENSIESIMEVAAIERIQLTQTLELLQSYLTMDTIQENDLRIAAFLKLEIEQLRADAEHNVREKTKQVLLFLDPSQQETIQQAQKVALKDLRKVYRDIYQTNQMIDNLALSS